MATLAMCAFCYMGLGGSGETSLTEAPRTARPSLATATKGSFAVGMAEGKAKETEGRLVVGGGGGEAAAVELHVLLKGEHNAAVQPKVEVALLSLVLFGKLDLCQALSIYLLSDMPSKADGKVLLHFAHHSTPFKSKV